ncbi:hypothetical protein NIR10_004623 [Salmonella enterica]|nr:hypothetical protein [Salmonella enterica]
MVKYQPFLNKGKEMKITLFAKRVIAPLAPVVALAAIVGLTHAHNTRIATKLAVVVAMVASLAGCASYGELSARCSAGDVNACVSKANRDNALGGALMGLQAAQVQQAQQQPQQMGITDCNPTINGGFSCHSY